MKQIRKSKSCLKRNAPATIVCLPNLMIKLTRLHTRLSAEHSKLSSGLYRRIALDERAQRYADMGDMRAFYGSLRTFTKTEVPC